jgi:hypothetical protein
MTPGERRARIRALVHGLDSREIEALIAGLRDDITKERSRRAHIDALLDERRGYERSGNEKGARAVDEQLAHYGHVAETRAGSRSRGAAA